MWIILEDSQASCSADYASWSWPLSVLCPPGFSATSSTCLFQVILPLQVAFLGKASFKCPSVPCVGPTSDPWEKRTWDSRAAPSAMPSSLCGLKLWKAQPLSCVTLCAPGLHVLSWKPLSLSTRQGVKPLPSTCTERNIVPSLLPSVAFTHSLEEGRGSHWQG